jgi:hypothetical protein
MSKVLSNSKSVGATRRQSSIATKLVHAAALSALLIPLGSVATEAGPVTCGFSGPSGTPGYSGNAGCSNFGGSSNTFTWYDGTGNELYRFELAFTGLSATSGFLVTIDDISMDSSQFAARSTLFPGYVPIPVVDPNGPYATAGAFRDFYVSDTSGNPLVTQWTSYDFLIHWTYDSENNGFPGGGGAARVLHNIGNPSNPNYVAGPGYDEDMCLTFNNCVYDPDPGIRSGDTDFQSFTVATVPEPSALALLGTGSLAGLLVRRRRKKD